MKKIFSNKWIKFAIAASLYILWVIWLGNYWWFVGLGIIFDLYVTRKVHWAFWKLKNPKNGKQPKIIEWIDAIIFAVIAATFIRLFFIEAYTIPTSSMEKSMLVGDYLFVSKTSYGPKMPNTPIAFPFVHHTMPFSQTKKSFSTAIQRPYKRIAGFGPINRDDVVVFNFPEGDTVALNIQNSSYYQLVREVGRERVWTDKRTFGEIIYRPVDKRENYIKRCVAIAGDSLEIRDGQVYRNGEPQTGLEGLQFNYAITTDGSRLNPKSLDRLGIALDDRHVRNAGQYYFPLSEKVANQFSNFKNVVSVNKIIYPVTAVEENIFPYSKEYAWNRDNFGPIWIPQKGAATPLDLHNLPFYRRIIEVYEENDLKVENDEIFINGEKADSYTFKMDYYWMMGDNRHNSLDSRYWGYVPEDHVVGKAIFVWLSLDKDKTGLSKIRWKRFFNFVH